MEADFGVEYLPLEELAAACDILSLHCAVNDQTQNMVNADLVSKMKPGIILVNTARGDLVDNLAVRQGLMDGRIGGIAMDTLAPVSYTHLDVYKRQHRGGPSPPHQRG